MHPRIAEVLAELDARAATLDRAVEAVPAAQRERRPSPEQWSAAEVVDHVGLVETRIAQLLASRVAAARDAGVGAEAETGSIAATLDVTRLLDRSRTLTAGEASQPQAGVTAEAAAERLTRGRAAMRDVLAAADGLALSEIVVPHPLLGPLDVYQWVLFVGAHEARHAAQIDAAASQLASQLAASDG